MVGGEVYYLFILYNGSCFIMLSVILVGAFFFFFFFFNAFVYLFDSVGLIDLLVCANK